MKRMLKVLITGGAGFIPSSLAEGLLEKRNYAVVCVDNFLTGKRENIPNHPNCTFIHCDVNNFNDIASVMMTYRFDYVFHYAAVVGVKRTLDNPLLVLDDIKGIKNILNLSKNTGVKRVFFSSSSEVYGEPVELPQNEETTPLNSRLPYAIVKNLGESYFKSYYHTHNLSYTIFRFFNTYGLKQSTDFVMNKFIQAATENRDITVYGDGSQTRTFCHINDNIEATINALEQNKYVNDVLNIGSDIEITIKDLAKTIIRLSNSTSNIIHLPPLEEGDMTRRMPDNTKMKLLLSRDLTPLEEGILSVLKSRQKMVSSKYVHLISPALANGTY